MKLWMMARPSSSPSIEARWMASSPPSLSALPAWLPVAHVALRMATARSRGQSRLRRVSAGRTRDRAEADNNLPSCIARHLSTPVRRPGLRRGSSTYLFGKTMTTTQPNGALQLPSNHEHPRPTQHPMRGASIQNPSSLARGAHHRYNRRGGNRPCLRASKTNGKSGPPRIPRSCTRAPTVHALQSK